MFIVFLIFDGGMNSISWEKSFLSVSSSDFRLLDWISNFGDSFSFWEKWVDLYALLELIKESILTGLGSSDVVFKKSCTLTEADDRDKYKSSRWSKGKLALRNGITKGLNGKLVVSWSLEWKSSIEIAEFWKKSFLNWVKL